MSANISARFRDKTTDWMKFFVRQRCLRLADLLTDEIIDEHRRDPRGAVRHHSEALQEILNFVHFSSTDGKPFVYAAAPYREYRVGVLRSRGRRAEIGGEPTFSSEREAVHAVFLRRIESIRAVAATIASE